MAADTDSLRVGTAIRQSRSRWHRVGTTSLALHAAATTASSRMHTNRRMPGPTTRTSTKFQRAALQHWPHECTTAPVPAPTGFGALSPGTISSHSGTVQGICAAVWGGDMYRTKTGRVRCRIGGAPHTVRTEHGRTVVTVNGTVDLAAGATLYKVLRSKPSTAATTSLASSSATSNSRPSRRPRAGRRERGGPQARVLLGRRVSESAVRARGRTARGRQVAHEAAVSTIETAPALGPCCCRCHVREYWRCFSVYSDDAIRGQRR